MLVQHVVVHLVSVHCVQTSQRLVKVKEEEAEEEGGLEFSHSAPLLSVGAPLCCDWSTSLLGSVVRQGKKCPITHWWWLNLQLLLITYISDELHCTKMKRNIFNSSKQLKD